MKVVVIIDRSHGNAVTGEAWQETAIFDDSETLGDVLKHFGYLGSTSSRIQITVPHERQDSNHD